MSQLTIAGAAVMHASMKALPKRKGNRPTCPAARDTHGASMKALPKRKGNVLQVGKHGTSAASMKSLPKRKGNP